MIIIRKETEEALRQASLQDFERRMLKHGRRFFPVETADDERTRAMIHEGIERARRYGLVSERDICLFLNLLFSFGPHADTEQPWAAAILNYSLLPDPSEKAAWLQEASEAYQED